jgi:hypothetical protein
MTTGQEQLLAVALEHSNLVAQGEILGLQSDAALDT